MQNCDLMPVETPGASQEGTLAIELFLMENYRFRRNILNGKVEFAILPKADEDGDYGVCAIGRGACAQSRAGISQ